MKKHRISEVLPGSAGEELDIRPGDYVLSINGKEIEDIFDYNYFCETDHVDLLVETEDGTMVLKEDDRIFYDQSLIVDRYARNDSK